MKYTTIEERLNAPISFLKGVNPAIKGRGTVAELIARIKNGDAAITHKARNLRVTNLPLYKTTKKFDFEGFMPGRWTKRDGKHSVQYVPLFAFDIDKIALSETGELSEDHFNLLQKIRVLQHVFMAYATPSGGIRFLVWCNKATLETHEVIYMDMLDFFSDILRIPILKLSDTDDLIGLDPSTHKAVSFFFFTPDAEIYTNYESQNYNYYPPSITDAPKKEVKQLPIVRKGNTIASSTVNHGIFEKVESNEALASLPACWDKMEDLDAKLKNNKSGDFVGRHERVLYLAVNFRENDIPEEDAIDYCVRTYEMEDSDKGDTARTVKDVYKKEKGYKSPHSKKSDLKPIENPSKDNNIKTNGSDARSESDQFAENASKNYQKKLKSLKGKDKNDFPIDAFPEKTREIIKGFQIVDGYPLDFYAANAMVVISSLLGVGFKAQYKKGHEHFPILYMILVGDSSAGKSVSAKGLFNPLMDLEKEASQKFHVDISRWHNETLQIKDPKEREQVPKPKRKELVLDNSTMEAMIRTMHRNPRGIMYLQEEVLAWIKNMNSYRSGSDEQLWLKNFDGGFYKYSRVAGDQTITIEHLNASVVGGIQPGVIHHLLGNEKSVSGFSARLLFSYPFQTVAPYDSDLEVSAELTNNWLKIVKYVDKLPNRIDAGKSENELPIVEQVAIKCTDEGKLLYKKVLNELTDEINATDTDELKSMYGKLKSYTIRFALILEVLRCAEQEIAFKNWEDLEKNLKIGHESMDGAYQLMKYFKITGERVLQRVETPVNALKNEQQAWYKSLPIGGITWAEAVKFAKSSGLSESTTQRMLNNPILFKKLGNIYERKFA
jgi:Protein of unknown function (DUF3987)